MELVENQQPAQLPTMNHPNMMQRSTAQLPKLQLCPFDGTITQWQQFWEMFKAAVHDQPIPQIQKMTYLLGALRGEARMEAAGYAATEANYPVMIELLKEKFGDPNRIRQKLHKELQALPKASERMADVRKVVQQIERICRQLEGMGQSTEQTQFEVAIESKMPRWMLRSVYEEQGKDPNWTVQKLRKHIEKTLKIEEMVAEAHKDNIGVQRAPATEHRMATGTFAVNGNRFPRKLSCVFCKGEHWNEKCQVNATREMRLKKVAELNLCFKCLRTGHGAAQCTYNRPCFYCKENHNSALCPGKRGSQGP
uniref:CCHC-type domain-containing protein n=1 Tax=Plectus sambesii TaxID=2011161 RepID=A0A914UH45_9BILA